MDKTMRRKSMKKLPLMKRRYVYLINSFAIFLLLGVAYAWSIFVGPLEEWFGWSRAQTSLAFTINMICFAAGVTLCGLLSARYHYERIAQLAALMVAGGFILTTRVSAVWQLYFTYSILCGTGVGMMYSAVVTTIPVWFRDKPGLATGILVMGYALSTTFLGPICQHLLSTRGWQATFLTLGAVDLLVMGAGGFLVRLPLAKELAGLPKMPEFSRLSCRDMTTREMLSSISFYSFFLYLVAFSGCGFMIINHMSPFLTGDIGVTAARAAAAVSIGALINGIGRLVMGMLFDRLGSVSTARFLGIVNFILVTALCLSYQTKNPLLVAGCACFVLFAFGGYSATIPSITRGLFGEKHFAGNYSIVSMNTLLSGIPASLAGALQARSGNYKGMLVLMGACAVLAVAGSWGLGSKKVKL